MIEFVGLLGGVKTGVDLAKTVREMLKKDKPNIAEITEHVSNIQDALYQAREGLADAQEEIRTLRGQLDDRARMEAMGKDFVPEEGVYWLTDSPYCPVCWDVDRKPVRLAGPGKDITMGHRSWMCPFHNKVSYQIPNHYKPKGATA